jgi:hypothetical protein
MEPRSRNLKTATNGQTHATGEMQATHHQAGSNEILLPHFTGTILEFRSR